MKRDLTERLLKWSKSKYRTPLILKGARQVGKSWLIDDFANAFQHYVKINFEKQPQFKAAFSEEINIPQLLEKLTLYTNTPIIPGKTLLFLDEIQECPTAILYLRYFKEEYPNLHVIAAGSLLEFILESIGMPVGRVDYLFLTPLSFGEFLSANGRDDLRELSLMSSHDEMIDKLLKDYLRTYMWLGGMPEVVKAWLEHKDALLCQNIQDRLLHAYQDDFLKYAKKNQIEYVAKIFDAVPWQLGKKFVYSRVDADLRATTLNKALMLLKKANIIHQCFYSSGQKPPLHASINEKFFKVFFLDIGLAQRLLGLEYKNWLLNDMTVDNIGSMTEQFVAQEL